MASNFAVKKHSGAPMRLALVAAMALTACGADPSAHTANLASSSGHQSDALVEGECDLDGTWAIKISVPVSWMASTVLSAGDGELTQYVKATRTRNGDVVRESLQVCGTVLPDYRSRVGQKYATRFPDSLFDNSYLDPIEVESHFSGFTPGSTFHTDPVVSQMGVALPTALTDPWPTRGTDIKHAVDPEQDGHVGVTLAAETTAGYNLPPTNYTFGNKASKFYTAIRNIAVINGTQQSCDWATGDVAIPKIGNKLALNSHVLGCELKDGGHCNAAQTKFLDDAQPIYQVSGSGTVTMLRTDDDATCETVRDFTYIRL